MSQLLNASTLVHQLMNMSTDDKCENICVLHMAGWSQNLNN